MTIRTRANVSPRENCILSATAILSNYFSGRAASFASMTGAIGRKFPAEFDNWESCVMLAYPYSDSCKPIMSTSFSKVSAMSEPYFTNPPHTTRTVPNPPTPAGPFETADEAVDEFLSFTLGWATNPDDPPPEPEKVPGLPARHVGRRSTNATPAVER